MSLKLVILAAICLSGVVQGGVLPLVTYGSSYSGHTVDHSVAVPFSAPLAVAAPSAAYVQAPLSPYYPYSPVVSAF